MTSPFDIIKHLSEKTELEYDLKDYAPWVINKGFSNVLSSLFFVEAMNKYSHLDKDIQRDFYFHALSKAKRYGTWNKATINNNAEVVMNYYHVNRQVAESYLSILSEEAIKLLREKIHEGGSK